VPLYEYQCDGCGHRVEVLQKHSDPPPACETCTEEMSRQVSTTSFHLAGEGWAHDSYGLKPGDTG
jgi:putative FmdB family regulatory protein